MDHTGESGQAVSDGGWDSEFDSGSAQKSSEIPATDQRVRAGGDDFASRLSRRKLLKLARRISRVLWRSVPEKIISRLSRLHPDDAKDILQLCDGRDASLVMAAVYMDDVKMARILLEVGGDVNFVNYIEKTALYAAFQRQNAEMIKLLIEKGATAYYLNKQNNWLFTKAIGENDVDTVNSLLDNGADPNQKLSCSETPLHKAVWSGRLEMVKLLVARGAQTNITDGRWTTPLHIACRYDLLEIAKCLLENGAAVNGFDPEKPRSSAKTPLHEAARSGSLEMVKFLVARGAEINIPDFIDETPLQIACLNDNVVMAKYLIENGAAVNALDLRGSTCLMVACKGRKVEVARYLLESGLDPKQTTLSNETALHFAAWAGNIEATKLLVSEGVDVNVMDTRHDTALLIACRERFAEIVEYLIDNGARTDIVDAQGNNCLMVACKMACVSVVQVLLEKGFDPNFKSFSHQTVLHEAVRKNATKVVELLLAHGARLLVDSNGYTPLVTAILEDNVHIAQCILESPTVTRIEKAEALELLAAKVVNENFTQAYQYLYRAMVERHLDPSDVLLKAHRPQVPALGSVVESQTREELESQRHNQATLQFECLLAVERILGSGDNHVYDFFQKTRDDLFNRQHYSDALALWVYSLKFPHIADYRSNGAFPTMLLNLYSPAFKEVEQGLEAAVLGVEQGARAMALQDCSAFLKLALEVAADESDRNQLQALVQRLLAAQPTFDQGLTLLHFDLEGYGVGLPLDEQSAALVAFLIQCGADVNATSSLGNTPLHDIVVCEDEDLEEIVCKISRIILEGGYHLDLRNHINMTALDLAEMRKVRAVIQEYCPPSLMCLAATTVVQHGEPYQHLVPTMVQDFISEHRPTQQ